VALAQEGFADFADGGSIRLPPTRARRRRPEMSDGDKIEPARVAAAAVWFRRSAEEEFRDR
jgi:hypothetical protein